MLFACDVYGLVEFRSKVTIFIYEKKRFENMLFVIRCKDLF